MPTTNQFDTFLSVIAPRLLFSLQCNLNRCSHVPYSRQRSSFSMAENQDRLIKVAASHYTTLILCTVSSER